MKEIQPKVSEKNIHFKKKLNHKEKIKTIHVRNVTRRKQDSSVPSGNHHLAAF